MPKELTHWWLAAEAVRQLPGNLTTRLLLEEHQAAYLTGAVLPDTLLHLVLGRWASRALQLASNFHQPSGNSFSPLLHFAEKTPLTPAVTACLLGIASHIEADIVFHPYVCALSGNDIGKHYQIETELDLSLLAQGKKPAVLRLDELLSVKGVKDVSLQILQGVFDPDSTLPDKVLVQALQLHSRIQGMYGSPLWQSLALMLGLVPSHWLRSHQKLFYPFNWHQGRIKDWPGHWQEQITGQKRRDTPEELSIDACNRINGLLRRVDEQGVVCCFREHPGENLVTGLAPA